MAGRAAAIATLMVAAGLMLTPASAQTANTEPPVPPTPAAKPAKPAAKAPGGYYIEFRAARIGIYGHSYVAYGRLDRNGNAESTTYADLHPVGNYAVMALGHFVPVPANKEWDPEVLELPVAFKYRIRLNDAQYNKLLAARKELDEKTSYWNVATNNCNHYVGKLAEAVGLRVPAEFHLSMVFLPDLIEMNEKSHPAMTTPATAPAKPAKKKPANAAAAAADSNASGR